MASEVTIKFNRIESEAKKIMEAGAELVAETANQIEADVKSVWAYTKIPIKIKNRSRSSGVVRADVAAGSNKRFYAAFLENGTTDLAPNPAMTPAAERAWPRFKAAAQRIERKLG